MTLHDKYANAPLRAYQGLVTDLSDDAGTDIKVALLDAAHIPALDTHATWADVSPDEVTGTNYTAGGESLANMTYTASGRVVTFDADDVVWADSTIDAGYAVVYDDTPAADADKSLLTLVDFEGTESSESGNFTIEWSASGIFQIDTNPA